MYVTIGLILTVFGLFYLYLVWNFNYWKKRGIPGPKPMAFLGNLPSAMTQKRNVTYDFDDIYKAYKSNSAVGLFNMRSPQLMVIDPVLIREVLVKNFKSFAANEFGELVDKDSDPLFGRNPFMLKGEEWKHRRGEITPAFTATRMKALYPLMGEVCNRLTEYIKKNSSGPFNTKELMAKYTTDVVSNCVFALDAESFKYEKPAIREMGRKIMDFSTKIQIIMFLTALFPFITKFYKFNFVPKDVEEFFIRIMKDAIKYRKDNNIERLDYLDHLLQLEAKKQMTEVDMAGHGVSFFVDGFETSSIVLSNCIYDIAGHKNVQEKLRGEIKKVLDKNEGLTYESIGEMEYLDQVFNESLRLHPIASVMSKKCTETTEIIDSKDKSYKIEEGTSVVIPLYSILLDENHYEDPYKFNPDRFSEENGGVKAYKDRGVFMPFSEGPRMCIGMRFAVAQAKRGIVEIVKNFEITVNEKTKEPFIYDPKEFMLVPVGGIWLDFKPI